MGSDASKLYDEAVGTAVAAAQSATSSSSSSSSSTPSVNLSKHRHILAMQRRLAAAMPGVLSRLVKNNRGCGGGAMRIEYGKDGILLWEGSFGNLSSSESSGPMTVDSLLEIASCTKLVVATCICKYAEEGRLSLNDTLDKFFSFGSSAPNKTQLPARFLVVDGEDCSHLVSIKSLLNHTSGLVDYWRDSDANARGKQNSFVKTFNGDPNRSWKPLEIMEYIPKLVLPSNKQNKLRKPSSRASQSFYHYSDTNYILLALIIERLSGMSLAQFLGEAVSKRLGLRGTFLSHTSVLAESKSDAPNSGNAMPSFATLSTTVPPQLSSYCSHRYEGKDDLYDRAHQNADWGGGGLVSNLRDMCKFMRSLAIVKPKAVSNTPSFFNDLSTLKAMISNRVNTGDDGIDYGSGIFVVDGEPDDKAFETWEEEHATGKLNDIEWYPEEEDWRLIGHDGHGNSFMYAWPKAQVAMAGTLNNLSNDWWPLAQQAIKEICIATLQEGVIFFDAPPL